MILRAEAEGLPHEIMRVADLAGFNKAIFQDGVKIVVQDESVYVQRGQSWRYEGRLVGYDVDGDWHYGFGSDIPQEFVQTGVRIQWVLPI